MKRLAGILMLGIYMLSFMELHNLLRIPIFIAHFQEHQDKDESTTLWGFFREHYVGPVGWMRIMIVISNYLSGIRIVVSPY